jgi:GTP-binding protein
VRYKRFTSFTVADIPGLIEGAHEGKGLGIQFLRHLERTRALVFLVECTSKDIKKDFDVLLNELAQFSKNLSERSKIVAITKMDIAPDDIRRLTASKKWLAKNFGHVPVCRISAISGEGVQELVDMMWKQVEDQMAEENPEQKE